LYANTVSFTSSLPATLPLDSPGIGPDINCLLPSYSFDHLDDPTCFRVCVLEVGINNDYYWAPYDVKSISTLFTVKKTRFITVLNNGDEVTEEKLETMADLSTLTTSLPPLTWVTRGATL
jgi:hypothetical protein